MELFDITLFKIIKAIIAAFAVWGMLRVFDKITKIHFTQEWEKFSERSRAIYYSARMFSFCILIGLLI